jgi:hypothetical protein
MRRLLRRLEGRVIAGIDYSSHAVDVVLLDEDSDQAAWHHFPLTALPGWDSFDRARTVRAVMPTRSWWEDRGTIAIGIEDPRGYGAGHLYRIQGGILQTLPPDVLVHPWIPSAWRKANMIAGNATKQAVKIHSLRLVGASKATDEWSQDAHDAHLIARATRASLQRSEAA